ncbi:hypothetical protein PEP31012_00126 [Pandoraea eparura]|uniref:Phospholipase/carboxylesterase/thioesterase domain-containing protein n=1 Tax=Pandoraea eparura TaxID=2508291 RepID=A0A5E4RHT2_9BURK|nr:phospholipase [Pandoraea eparura]VVD61508.1 hypothetical protein PEP31012_00126 [Pandoraea eparura]
MSNGNPHLQAPVRVFGAPPGEASLAVILVHGRAQSPDWVHDMIVRRMALPGMAWCAPAAADGSWYPARFLEPVDANEPRLSQALACLDALTESLCAQGFPYESQVLMGFSQGACLCSEYVWRRQRRYRALVAFTGALIGPPGAARDMTHQTLAGMPVLLSTWDDDPYVPQDSVREAARWFDAAGAQVTLRIAAGTEHGIRAEEIKWARALLLDTCAGSGAAHP